MYTQNPRHITSTVVLFPVLLQAMHVPGELQLSADFSSKNHKLNENFEKLRKASIKMKTILDSCTSKYTTLSKGYSLRMIGIEINEIATAIHKSILTGDIKDTEDQIKIIQWFLIYLSRNTYIEKKSSDLSINGLGEDASKEGIKISQIRYYELQEKLKELRKSSTSKKEFINELNFLNDKQYSNFLEKENSAYSKIKEKNEKDLSPKEQQQKEIAIYFEQIEEIKNLFSNKPTIIDKPNDIKPKKVVSSDNDTQDNRSVITPSTLAYTLNYILETIENIRIWIRNMLETLKHYTTTTTEEREQINKNIATLKKLDKLLHNLENNLAGYLKTLNKKITGKSAPEQFNHVFSKHMSLNLQINYIKDKIKNIDKKNRQRITIQSETEKINAISEVITKLETASSKLGELIDKIQIKNEKSTSKKIANAAANVAIKGMYAFKKLTKKATLPKINFYSKKIIPEAANKRDFRKNSSAANRKSIDKKTPITTEQNKTLGQQRESYASIKNIEEEFIKLEKLISDIDKTLGRNQ